MMQHVATSKSEVAAFATGSESKSMVDSSANEQFGKLLKEQHATFPVVKPKASPSAQQPPSKKSSQQPIAEVTSDPSALVNEDITKRDNNSSSESVQANSVPKTNSSQDNTTAGHDETEGSDDIVIEEQGIKKALSDEPKVANTIDDTQVALNQNEKGSTDESSEVVAEEWVLLIDNLKKLAGVGESPISSLEELELLTTDLKLSDKAEKELFELISDSPFADNSRISLDGFIVPPVEDIKDPNGPVVIAKKPVEQTISMTEDQDSGASNTFVSVVDAQSAQNLSELVDKALAEVLDSVASEQLPVANIKQKMAEVLLEKPQLLQELNNQLQVASQKGVSAKQNTNELTLGRENKINPMLTYQQPESVEQVDLTLNNNKELLRTLVVETETAAETQAVKTEVALKLTNLKTTDAPVIQMQAQQLEADIKKVESVANSVNLAEEAVPTPQQVTSNSLKLNETDKALDNKDVKSILNLTDSQLDKVLENIAQRVFESKTSGEAISPVQLAQQVVTPKVAEIINSIESTSKDFISALKSGLEEFKNQLSQGREPGIDLKALMAEAFAKTTESATATVAKAPVNLEQIASSVSQVLDLAHSMSRTIEERHDQVYSATLRDVAQVQGEQSKQIQLNQLETKFDKAVNIAKPEGHQQLAEKVRWMVNTRNLVAEIRLDPAELGSVHVKVAMSGESATVNFVVQSQQARDAVDTATPRLREMLAEKGIELGQSSVRQESDGQQGHGASEFARKGAGENEVTDDLEIPEQVVAQQNIVNGALGGIDYFV